MAVSRTPEQFARRFRIIAEKVKENTVKNVKKAAIAADQAAVLATPVDTGRARANWLVSIGTPEYKYDDEATEGDVQSSLSQAQSTVAEYKLGSGGIFITNSVPYIVPLENGSSAQAPQGMTEAAIQAARRHLGDAKLLDGV